MAWLLRLPVLVILAVMAAAVMLLPAGHATIMGDHRIAQGFFYSALAIAMVCVMVALATENAVRGHGIRGYVVALVVGYGVLPVIFALPLVQMRMPITLGEAWFDMLSAFTTTGAAPRYGDALLPSITLWRALVGWLGGLYILVMASAVLMPLGLGGAEIITTASGAHIGAGKPVIDRLIDTTLTIFPLYGALTLALWFVLALAGEPSFVALITAMGVLSTSGIAPLAGGVAQTSGILGEVLIFLALFAALSRHVMPLHARIGRAGGRRFYDPELRLGLGIVLATSAALFVYHWIGRTPPTDATPLRAIWGGMLLALSFMTTTGFQTLSTQMAMDWAGLQSPGMLLMGLAIVGGGAATTAGGVKLLRIYSLLRHGERELEKLVHPHSLGGAGQGARFIRRKGALNAWVMFMLFALTIGAGTALLTICGLSFDASLAFAISALTNTGPLATALPDLGLSYDQLDTPELVILGALMVAGRLELLVLLAVLAPSSWRF